MVEISILWNQHWGYCRNLLGSHGKDVIGGLYTYNNLLYKYFICNMQPVQGIALGGCHFVYQ